MMFFRCQCTTAADAAVIGASIGVLGATGAPVTEVELAVGHAHEPHDAGRPTDPAQPAPPGPA
jgi:hypothetical protein